MKELMRRLLGLDRIGLSDSPLSIEFGEPPAPWAMLAGAVMVVALVALVYRHEPGGRRLRVALASLRACMLLVVLGLLASPNLVLTRERVEPSVVALLVDRSASMSERDTGDGAAASDPAAVASAPAAASQPSRFERAIALIGDSQRNVVDALRRRHRVELWSFAGTGERLTRDATPADAARLTDAAPAGTASDLPAAIDTLLMRTRGSRLSSIVVLSDGRQTVPAPTDELLREARQRGVQIHAVALGSRVPKPDIDVEPPLAGEDVFRKDIVSIGARARVAGMPPETPIALTLRDRRTDKLLERRTVKTAARESDPETDAVADAEFRFRPDSVGRLELRVTAEPLAGEQRLDNNSADVTVRVHEEKLRVLYVDGPPRFEYRFLKNSLMREPSVASSCLLLDATAAFVQEGTDPIKAFPVSPGDLANYDVVLMGDVDPRGDWISPAQISMLADFVAERGGGIAFIAGERAMPHRLSGTPLQKLLPVRADANSGGRWKEPARRGFVPRFTAEGRLHPLLRFEVDPAENDVTLAALPPWFWFARVLGPAPGAEVLAHHPEETAGDEPMPLIAIGRFGAGRTLYSGSDDVGRWRRYQGEAFYDGFWLNALRWLAGPRRWGTTHQWRLVSDRQSYDLDQTVTWRLTAADPETAERIERVSLRVDDANGRPAAQLTMRRAGGTGRAFEALFRPPATGAYTAVPHLPGAEAAADPPSRTISVSDGSIERRRTAADPDYLARLAKATGGSMIPAAGLVDAAARLPDRSLRVSDDITEPLWDSWLALLICAGLLATEWTARKLKGMA